MQIRDVSEQIKALMIQLKADQDSHPTVANGHALASLGAALKCHEEDRKNRQKITDAQDAEQKAVVEADKKMKEERKANLEARVHNLRKMRKEEPKAFSISHKQELEDAKKSLADLYSAFGIEVPEDLKKYEEHLEVKSASKEKK